jgi:scyllo-inositol 2-dehydrogenase (NADP+)
MALRDREIKLGVIGTGWVAAARHVPAFRRHPAVKVTSVFDRNPEKARRAASQWGVAHWSSNEVEFFDQSLDMVTICTPPWTHAQLTCAALDRGFHVFTEKPMAMNSEEAIAMVEAAKKANRLLCVSHNFLFARSVREADRILSRGSEVRYGLALQLSSDRRRLPDWYRQLPGGLFLDESPHMIYTLQHFLGRLDLDGCRVIWNSESGLPASIDVQLRGSRAAGQLTMLFEAPLSEWHVALVRREGAIDLDLFRDIVVSVKSDGKHRPMDILGTSLNAIGGHAAGFVRSGVRYAAHQQYWGHDEIIPRFVDAVLGKGPVPVDPAESLDVVRLTDEILKEFSRSH